MRTLPKPVFLLLLWLGALGPGFAATTAPVTSPARVSRSAAADSFVGSFSPDGRHLLFFSHANNLVTNDSSTPALDVFVRDLTSGAIRLISVSTNGRGGGDDHSPAASMSTNGFIAFESRASNVATNDTNGLSDVFVHNPATGRTTLVSVNSNRTSSATGPSFTPLLSHDGRRVIFESTASNLVAADSNPYRDVFARDLIAQTTAWVSRDATNVGFAAGPSESASISASGRYVAFEKRATNFLASNRRSEGEIYVRDIEANTTTWASIDVNTNFFATSGYPYRCYNPVLSADGRYVAFFAEGPFTFGAPQLYRRDLVAGVTLRLAIDITNAFGIPMSADGRVLAWISLGPNIATTGLTLWDDLGGTRLLSGGNVSALAPVLSADGNRLAWFTNNLFAGPNALDTLAGLNVFDRTTGNTQPACVTTNSLVAIPTETSVPVLHPTTNLVAFETLDWRLVSEDGNGASDVFLRDLDAATTTLVSAAAAERPAATASGMASLTEGALSADARFVAFTALDGNLVAGDTNRLPDVFVRDLLTGNLVAASARSQPFPGGGATLHFPTEEASTRPVLSGNGRVVAYRGEQPWLTQGSPLYWRDIEAEEPVLILSAGTVQATNTVVLNHDGNLVVFDSPSPVGALVPGGSGEFNNGSDIFLRDVSAGTNTLLSMNRFGTGTGDGASLQPVLSPDGQWVAFLSRATDLTSNTPPANVGFHVYAHHLPTRQTRLISTDSPNGLGLHATNPVFSADSRFVVFGARYYIQLTNIYRHDLVANATLLVCGGCQAASVSGDGRFVTFINQGYASGATWQVALRDMAFGLDSVISMAATGLGPAYQYAWGPPPTARITPDGRYVLFLSLATDLVGYDTNGLTDLFVRDRVTRRTSQITSNASGFGRGSGNSSVLQLAGDSRTAVLQSHADEFTAGDYNYRRDVLVLKLAEPDTDHDGLDDEWEQSYFHTLARDGAGDFDGDGASNRHEFEAHTDPTHSGSSFRIQGLVNENGFYWLTWGAVPGRSYYVQSRRNDVEGWLNGLVYPASSNSVRGYAGPASPSNRLYRVLLLD